MYSRLNVCTLKDAIISWPYVANSILNLMNNDYEHFGAIQTCSEFVAPFSITFAISTMNFATIVFLSHF